MSQLWPYVRSIRGKTLGEVLTVADAMPLPMTGLKAN